MRYKLRNWHIVESLIDAAEVGGMVEAALLIERKTFEEMVRFVMKATRESSVFISPFSSQQDKLEN